MASLDLFLGGKLQIKQPQEGYRAGTDAVLLASALPLRAGDHLVDLGTGVGTVMLCAARRVPNVMLTGIDINPEVLSYAKENLALNGFVGEVVEADVTQVGLATLNQGEAACVAFNPPYFDPKTQTPSDHGQRAQSRHHGTGTSLPPLDVWLRGAARLLKTRGVVAFIYPATGLADALGALSRPESPGRSWGGIEIFPLWPRAGEAAKRIIVRASKNSKTPLVVWPGHIMHESDGTYTAHTENVCRHGRALF